MGNKQTSFKSNSVDVKTKNKTNQLWSDERILNNHNELKQLLQSHKQSPFNTDLINDIQNWFLWEDEYFIKQLQHQQNMEKYIKSLKMDEYSALLGQLRNNINHYNNRGQDVIKIFKHHTPLSHNIISIIIQFSILQKDLTEPLLKTTNFTKFNKGWQIIPNISRQTNNCNVLLHGDLNQDKFDGLMLINGGCIICTKKFDPSSANWLCLEMKFKCYSMDDYLWIDMKHPGVQIGYTPTNANNEVMFLGPFGHQQGYEKNYCKIMPNEGRLILGDKELKDCDRIKEVGMNTGEHYVRIINECDKLRMEYIDDMNGGVIYKLERKISGLYDDCMTDNRISIQNRDGDNCYMFISELRLYCLPR